MAYSPDGARIASGDDYRDIHIWDAQTGAFLLKIDAPDDVISVAYSPDGTRLASGIRDDTVRIWNAETGEQTAVLGGHTDEVWSVAYSPDGTRIASGSKDHTGPHLERRDRRTNSGT